jgi:hypothetical protein
MISAVAIIAVQGPATLSLADQGDDNEQGDDLTPSPEDTGGTDNGDDEGAADDECADPVKDGGNLAPCETTITAAKTATGFWSWRPPTPGP